MLITGAEFQGPTIPGRPQPTMTYAYLQGFREVRVSFTVADDEEATAWLRAFADGGLQYVGGPHAHVVDTTYIPPTPEFEKALAEVLDDGQAPPVDTVPVATEAEVTQPTVTESTPPASVADIVAKAIDDIGMFPEPQAQAAPTVKKSLPTPKAAPVPDSTPASGEYLDDTTPGEVPEAEPGAEYTFRGLYAKVQQSGRVAYQFIRFDGTKTPPQAFDIALDHGHPWAVAKAAEKPTKQTRAKSTRTKATTSEKPTTTPAPVVQAVTVTPPVAIEDPDNVPPPGQVRLRIDTHSPDAVQAVAAPTHSNPVPITEHQALHVHDPELALPASWLHEVGIHDNMELATGLIDIVTCGVAQLSARWAPWRTLDMAKQADALISYFDSISHLDELGKVHEFMNEGGKQLRSPALVQAVMKVAKSKSGK